MPIDKFGMQRPFLFTLFNNENVELGLLEKSEVFGTASIRGPYCDGEERVATFALNKKAVGVCCLKISYITSREEVDLKR